MSVVLWSRFDRNGECWLWHRVEYPEVAYGRLMIGQRNRLAHRWVYEQLVRPLPANVELDHICETPGCVNPEHLSEVTRLEHAQRGARRRRAIPQSATTLELIGKAAA